MSPAAFFQRNLPRLAWIALLIAIGLAGWVGGRTLSLLRQHPVTTARLAPPAGEPLESVSLTGLDLSLFRGRPGAALGSQGPLAQRFRLAGTFFEFTALGSSRRMAILDDAAHQEQRLVIEQDRLDDVVVVSIQRDRVRIRADSGEEAELTLNFAGDDTAASQAGVTNGIVADTAAAAPFGGVRVGDTRWQFDRATLLRYYQDLRDQPERLVLLFDSLKPEYTPDQRIQGYRLGVEGEKPFFDAVGLEQDDVIQRVNNVDMTNRRRAEFFIGQFVRNDATAFMIDVVRGGATNRLVYELR